MAAIGSRFNSLLINASDPLEKSKKGGKKRGDPKEQRGPKKAQTKNLDSITPIGENLKNSEKFDKNNPNNENLKKLTKSDNFNEKYNENNRELPENTNFDKKISAHAHDKNGKNIKIVVRDVSRDFSTDPSVSDKNRKFYDKNRENSDRKQSGNVSEKFANSRDNRIKPSDMLGGRRDSPRGNPAGNTRETEPENDPDPVPREEPRENGREDQNEDFQNYPKDTKHGNYRKMMAVRGRTFDRHGARREERGLEKRQGRGAYNWGEKGETNEARETDQTVTEVPDTEKKEEYVPVVYTLDQYKQMCQERVFDPLHWKEQTKVETELDEAEDVRQYEYHRNQGGSRGRGGRGGSRGGSRGRGGSRPPRGEQSGGAPREQKPTPADVKIDDIRDFPAL